MNCEEHSEGFSAALEGLEFYENPYRGICDDPARFMSWFAGWCQGKEFDTVNKSGG
jgi:hypothetical protein